MKKWGAEYRNSIHFGTSRGTMWTGMVVSYTWALRYVKKHGLRMKAFNEGKVYLLSMKSVRCQDCCWTYTYIPEVTWVYLVIIITLECRSYQAGVDVLNLTIKQSNLYGFMRIIISKLTSYVNYLTRGKVGTILHVE